MTYAKIFGVWAMLAGLMVCNGALRVALLTPILGTEAGEMTSVFIGISIIFAAPRPFLTRHAPLAPGEILRISGIWVALTIGFEAGMGLATGRTWREIAGAYSIAAGSFWPVILLAVAYSPFIWLRRVEALPAGRVTK